MADLLDDIEVFAVACGVRLRRYQLRPARVIVERALSGRGGVVVVMMSRQAGKNEVSALVEAYLLARHAVKGGQIVKASPTFQPQVINSMLRLQQRCPGWLPPLRRREGYIYEVGAARCLFLSAAPTSNVVGATASLMLECDEAQDVDPAKWRKDFLPMAASTNAVTVYWGTAWTDRTLLALMKREADEVVVVDADQVGAEVLAYRDYVGQQVTQLGRQHPLVRSQYYLEDIEAGGGLFDERRMAAMRGEHRRRREPEDGKVYALLVDVGGAEESAQGQGIARSENAKRDATAMTVVEVEHRPDGLRGYKVVERRVWVGAGHAALHSQIVEHAEHWRAGRVVVDATGLGSGLAQFLAVRLGEHRVKSVVFNATKKADIGWRFLGMVDTGRYKDYIDDGLPDTKQFWYEVGACQFEALAGGGLRWGVWEAPRYDDSICRGHDDLLLSAALCVVLDDEPALGVGAGDVVVAHDVVEEIDRGGF